MRPADKKQLQRLDKAMAAMAKFIKRPRGEVYWPIFDRLDKERQQVANRNFSRLDEATARMEHAA